MTSIYLIYRTRLIGRDRSALRGRVKEEKLLGIATHWPLSQNGTGMYVQREQQSDTSPCTILLMYIHGDPATHALPKAHRDPL